MSRWCKNSNGVLYAGIGNHLDHWTILPINMINPVGIFQFTHQDPGKSKSRTITYAPIYGEHGRRESIKGSNGTRQDYTFNEKGQLTKRVITSTKGDKRILLYQGGYVVREEAGGKAFRYHYDFDTATGKKFLISIEELKGNDVVHERKFDYDIDTHGRYTRVSVSFDGKHQMTVTRSYSE